MISRARQHHAVLAFLLTHAGLADSVGWLLVSMPDSNHAQNDPLAGSYKGLGIYCKDCCWLGAEKGYNKRLGSQERLGQQANHGDNADQLEACECVLEREKT